MIEVLDERDIKLDQKNDILELPRTIRMNYTAVYTDRIGRDKEQIATRLKYTPVYFTVYQGKTHMRMTIE